MVYQPKFSAHQVGTLSDADWAKFLVKFYKAKYKQNLNGKQKRAQADLAAAGIPDWVVKQRPPPALPVVEPVNEAEPPPSEPPVPTKPLPAPTPVKPPTTAPAVPGVPSVAIPDTDSLEAELRRKIDEWLNRKLKR